MCDKDEAAQLYYVQQVEESMGGWDLPEKASVYYHWTQPCDTVARRTPAVEDSDFRYFGDLRVQAAIG
jgi:hypothetical protein